ncbi:MAG: phosphoglucosamine mutase [Thermonemataceae bacterium]
MTLIKSISGIRGTIGGIPRDNLTPLDIVKYTAAFGTWLKQSTSSSSVVIGRDARISGEMVSQLVSATLQGLGLPVVDLGLSTTPTVELAVVQEAASGGIIITASHNPIEWNALKLLNQKGEFISSEEGQQVLTLANQEDFHFAEAQALGTYHTDDTYIQQHITQILALPIIDTAAIQSRQWRIAIDCVNSTGGLALPPLLKALGVAQIGTFHCEPTGQFPRNPEPLPENLVAFSQEVTKGDFDLGIVVDPDVDRLAFICEDGTPFGEEYTLVAVADYVLQHQPGNTVSNLSSTQALKDITEKAGQHYFASAVGEVNVVKAMKAHQAVIGGEGNGGIIYPALHYGRDALVGIALFLSHLAKVGKPISALRKQYPDYHISKNKITLTPSIEVDSVLASLQHKYQDHPIDTVDGVKVIFEQAHAWVHLRKSNTEPIIRIYAEAPTPEEANQLAEQLMTDVKAISVS